jgi:predicted TIM-barrel fold metal-dependent hydrolase
MNTRRDFLRAAALGGAALATGIVPATLRAAGSQAADPAVPESPPEARGRAIVDWHTHWIAPGVADLLGRRKTAPGLVTRADGKRYPLTKDGVSPRAQDPIWFDVDLRLRHLDSVGIRRQILSFVGPAYDGSLSAEDARPFWRSQNDGLAELVRSHPDRFSALATLPTARPDWAAEELDRAHKDLGLIGATLPLDAFVSLESARSLAPVFRVAQKNRSHIYIHRGPAAATVPRQQPEVGPANAWFGLADYSSPNGAPPNQEGDAAYARATLLTSAHLATGAITLALTDFLDPYPDVTVQLTMIGGSISFVSEQIELAAERSGLPDPRKKLRRIYLDTGASGRGPRGIALAAKVFGSDRILFGTDYGPWPSTAPFIAAVNHAALRPEEKRGVFVENGRSILLRHQQIV